MMARNAKTVGMCMFCVKNCMVAVNPFPPNQPRASWAPWAKKTIPVTTRRTRLAMLSSVAMSLRNMEDLLSVGSRNRIARVRRFVW